MLFRSAFLLEDMLHLHSHLDSMTRQVKIEIVCEKRFKLQTYQGSLGYDSTMLLLNTEEMLMSTAIGKDHRFTTKCTNLLPPI